jgi:hypothetical protein
MLTALTWIDDLDRLDGELTAAAADARRRGSGLGVAFACALRGITAWKRGQLRGAEAEFRTGFQIATEMGWVAGSPFWLAILVEVLNEAGNSTRPIA